MEAALISLAENYDKIARSELKFRIVALGYMAHTTITSFFFLFAEIIYLTLTLF